MPLTAEQTGTEEMEIELLPMEHAVGLKLPTYATEHAAGMDLTAALEEAIEIGPGERALIPTGLAIGLPAGFEAQIRPRSGLAVKHGVTVLNTPGTVDADYRGEIKVLLINHDLHDTVTLRRGDRIAQLVVQRFERVVFEPTATLSDTARGTGGYGSTGGFSTAEKEIR